MSGSSTNCGRVKSSGKHGELIDVCCDISLDNSNGTYRIKNVICKFIEASLSDVAEITLYQSTQNPGGRVVLTLPTEFQTLVTELRRQSQGLIGKRVQSFEELRSDVDSAHLLRSDIYRNDPEHLQVRGIRFRGHDGITGIQLRLNNRLLSLGKTYYFYITSICRQTVDDVNFNAFPKSEFSRFLLETLTSMSILHGKEYYHGDIKAKNMMSCPSQSNIKYKLIDWGRLMSVKQFDSRYGYGGSTQMGSPLGFYFLHKKLGSPLPLQTVKLFLESKAYKELNSYPYFTKELWPEIWGSFKRFMSSNRVADKDLFARYRFTLDTFNYGLVIYLLVLKNNMDMRRYKELIHRLTMYDHPQFILNAQDALAVVRNKLA